MNNILFIVGLPGSGKSTLAKNINKDNNGKYTIIDDPKDFKKDVLPYLDNDLIIVDPSLCIEENRTSAVNMIRKNNPDVNIDWIYFENNPNACLGNSYIRNRVNMISFKPIKIVDNYIKSLSMVYTIPKGSNLVRVYNTD